MRTDAHDFFHIFLGGGRPTTAKKNRKFVICGLGVIASTRKNMKKIMDTCFHKTH